MKEAEEFLFSKKLSLHPKLKLYTHKEVCELLGEYANKVSKKEAKDFAHWIVMNQSKIKLGQRYYDFYEELYDEFKNQE